MATIFFARTHSKGRSVIFSSKPIAVIFLAATLLSTGCGGGGSNSGEGGGGADGNGPQLTLISPFMVMSDVPIGQFTVIGSGFNQQTQVLIDGKPTSFSILLEDSEHIEVNLPGAPSVGVHQVTVQNGSQISNSLPFTYYAPQPAPTRFFNAIPGYYAGPESDSDSVVVGDFNGDGRTDVVINTPPQSGDTVASMLLLGQADGSLSPPQYLSNVSAVVAGDVDGDGTIDLVGFVGTSCQVYLNDGKANFRSGPACPSVEAAELSARLVDVNGDGIPDLIIGGQYSPIYLMLNQGGGNFTPPATFSSTGNNSSFVIADFSGDGLPDIAYNAVNATTGAEEVHILQNQGGGNFKDTLPPSLQGLSGVLATADFNLDGIPDLAIAVNATPAVRLFTFLGQGNDVFNEASGELDIFPSPFAEYKFVAGDFDHDGFPDLVGENGGTQPSQLLYLWGDGKGGFSPLFVNGPQGSSLATGDINGDGLPDVLVPDTFNEISVALGQSGRNLPSLPLLYPAPGPSISIADVNGDGLPDIMVGNSIFLNAGNRSFNPAVTVTTNGWQIADLNGDGLADLVGGSGSDVLVWPGTGNPNYPGSPITYTPPQPVAASELQIVDIDRDGYLDLVSPGVILYTDKQYNFTAVQVAFTAPYVVADFNGDGYLDIATNGQTWLGGAGRSFTPVSNQLDIADGDTAAVADFNKGGQLDIVTSGGMVWYGTGTGDFYMQGELTAEQSLFGIVVGDFNHDGLPDIAGGMLLSQQIVVFVNDGQGGFERSYYASGASAINIASGDFNKDGKTDLVVSNFVVDFATPNALVIFGK